MHAWACRAWDLNAAVHSHHVTRTASGLEKGRGLQACDHSCDSACNAGCDSSCDMILISCDSSCNSLGLDLCLTPRFRRSMPRLTNVHLPNRVACMFLLLRLQAASSCDSSCDSSCNSHSHDPHSHSPSSNSHSHDPHSHSPSSNSHSHDPHSHGASPPSPAHLPHYHDPRRRPRRPAPPQSPAPPNLPPFPLLPPSEQVVFLARLYESFGGADWTINDRWMTGEPLR